MVVDRFFLQGNGGIGSFLVDPNEEPGTLNVGRFIFDNLFKIILPIVVINLVAGIIIDTFGSLKEDLEQKEQDVENICFICGFDREKIEKNSESGFQYHIKKEHYMWNYLFFRAYLQDKQETEFSGTESYIKDKIDQYDISWFPVGK